MFPYIYIVLIFRGIKLATLPAGKESDLASLAVCAGFDYVKYSNQQFIEAFVKAQSGYQTLIVSYFEGKKTRFK